ncbi:S8 family serine peptidase [Pilimelia columellifera]|uniref:Peptidase S8/S53 domain-containing protein n=1 Tax=Pilimelia columellifera subsp. columellifera TaxID=706583 RepID=A0ABN3NIM5_9ACTN
MSDSKPDPRGRRDDDEHGAYPRSGRSGRVSGSARPVEPRRERYLVAPLPPELAPAGAALGGPMTDPKTVLAQLDADPRTTVRRVISAPERVSMLGAGGPSLVFPDVAIVEMEPDRAVELAATPMVHVEPDLPLSYAAAETGLNIADPSLTPLGEDVAVTFDIHGADGKPLEHAEIYVMSHTFPVRGITDARGRAELPVPAGALGSVTGVYVKPRYDYWSTWNARPDLSVTSPNLITCPTLTETFPGLGEGRQVDTWARRAMRFDALPPNFRGHGVKIAVIDSGADVGHPELADRFVGGRDITTGTDDGWRVDTLGHGTHCSGIIGGTGAGIVGIAPEAELHACKVFPGGRFSDLIEALDYCITHQIDVVNLSLGSAQGSELIARKVEQARQAGVACVAAAGNSGGAVGFPASLPNVLAVAALGKAGEFPPGTYHATQVQGAPTPEGFFTAKFTCFGPEVDVVGPGVAIVSSVPPANYAAWDGTSFAAPCVTGLAALVLAHHPDFRAQFAARDAARVDRLFDLIRRSCRPVRLADPGRSGAGLPDAVAALGLIAIGSPPMMPTVPALATLWSAMAQAGLLPGVGFTPHMMGVPASVDRVSGAAGNQQLASMSAWPASPEENPASSNRAEPSKKEGNGAATSPTADQSLAPLRAALRAAGLLPAPEPAR